MFKLIIEKQILLNYLLMVAGAVDRKQSLPVLSNILLNLNASELSLTATDLEIEITGRLTCEAEGGDIITVPAKKIIDIVRSLEDQAPLTIEFDKQLLIVKQGRSQFKLTTLPADNFPTTDNEPNDFEVTVSRLGFIQLLQSTQFAIAQQDMRVYLNGLLLEFDQTTMTAIGTDAHRMALCRLPCDLGSIAHRLLLPRKGVHEVLRLLQGISDESVLLSISKNHLKILTGHYTFLSKLIESRLPSYSRIAVRNYDRQVTLDCELLKRALLRMIILTHEKHRAVLLHLQPNVLTLTSTNQEQEESTESLVAETQGPELSIAINASYLLDALNYINEGSVILAFKDGDSHMLVESSRNEHYQYVIMPRKL